VLALRLAQTAPMYALQVNQMLDGRRRLCGAELGGIYEG